MTEFQCGLCGISDAGRYFGTVVTPFPPVGWVWGGLNGKENWFCGGCKQWTEYRSAEFICAKEAEEG